MSVFLLPTWIYYDDGRALLVQANTPLARLSPGWAESPAGPFNASVPGPVEAEPPVLEDEPDREDPLDLNVPDVAAEPRRRGWPKGKPRTPKE